LQSEAIFDSKSVWRPGSARARRGKLQRSPDPLAGFKGDIRSSNLGLRVYEGRNFNFWNYSRRSAL